MIQHLKHHMQTICGDSSICFNGMLCMAPIQGVGQGNGTGPQIWAVVSTPVLEMMQAQGHLCHFRTAITGEEIRFIGCAFVDDANLLVTSPSLEAEHTEVAMRMQNSATDWEGGVHATGGAVVP